MSDHDNLRDRIAYILESHAHMAMDQQACAIIDEFGLTVVEAPGGISDYSPFTGKPVVQPDKWWVEGERVFTREQQ